MLIRFFFRSVVWLVFCLLVRLFVSLFVCFFIDSFIYLFIPMSSTCRVYAANGGSRGPTVQLPHVRLHKTKNDLKFSVISRRTVPIL
jgi:hypothetical protein